MNAIVFIVDDVLAFLFISHIYLCIYLLSYKFEIINTQHTFRKIYVLLYKNNLKWIHPTEYVQNRVYLHNPLSLHLYIYLFNILRP